MPLQTGVSANKTCRCRHKHCVVLQGKNSEEACAALHELIRSDPELTGEGPIAAGRLEYTYGLEAKRGLKATVAIPAGTILAVAECGVKLMTQECGSLSDETDMALRWVGAACVQSSRSGQQVWWWLLGDGCIHFARLAAAYAYSGATGITSFRHTKRGLCVGLGLRHLSDAVLSAWSNQCATCANLPPAPGAVMSMTAKEIQDYVQDKHNCCLVTITDEAYYVLVACKPIPAGGHIWAHYGPGSHVTLSSARQRGARM